ncbi:hypothetical protein WMY93_014564 [Mugilogobius chulae]|uniref:Protein kinase domain-containing protein n=1 Tax=Mugilogobius chulae TaxID=88201 RepID=A0AAW0P1H5_9GOBI
MDLYETLEVMGEGSYGEVSRCRNKLTGQTVAVKRIKDFNNVAIQREVSMLQQISRLDPDVHNLVRFHRHFISSSGQHYLEFEQLDQSLHDLILQQKKGIPLNDVRPMAKQLLIALEGLRGLGIVHTDIKPDNIMLVDHQKEPFRVKLIDFGLARQKDQLRVGMRMQPLGFRAPEVSLGLPLSEAVDVWSLGCCLLAFYLYLLPFDVRVSYDNVKQISHILGVPDEQLLAKATRGAEFFVHEKSRWRLKTSSELKRETGRYPETGEHNLESVRSLQDLLLNCTERISRVEYLDRVVFLDLIQKMLTMNPEKRITPAEALEHPFITRSYMQEYLEYFTESEQKMSLKKVPEPHREAGTQTDPKEPAFKSTVHDEEPTSKSKSRVHDAKSSKCEKNSGTKSPVSQQPSHSLTVVPAKYFQQHQMSSGMKEEEAETDSPSIVLRPSLLPVTSIASELETNNQTNKYQTITNTETQSAKEKDNWETRSPVDLQPCPSKKHSDLSLSHLHNKGEEEVAGETESPTILEESDLQPCSSKSHSHLQSHHNDKGEEGVPVETKSPAVLEESGLQHDDCKPTVEAMTLQLIDKLRRYLQKKKEQSSIQTLFESPANFVAAQEHTQIMSPAQTRSVVSSEGDNSNGKTRLEEQIQKGAAQTRLYTTTREDKRTEKDIGDEAQKNVEQQILTNEKTSLEDLVKDVDEEENTSSSLSKELNVEC